LDRLSESYFIYETKFCFTEEEATILLVDEVEIEKLKAAVFKAVRESNFSKAKEIQQKIDRILMSKTQASTNQKIVQGEKDYQLFVSSLI
jgi:hypothetical protein